jgi:hypothetical protein
MTQIQGDTIRKEPMAILDTTGSMNEQASPNSPMTKRELATSVFRILVQHLANADTQGADETGGGGLLTISFADGIAIEVGDLNPGNFDSKWNAIKWKGGTYIVPAFKLMMGNFEEEFGHLPLAIQPQLMATVLTDGELYDAGTANQWLRGVQGNVYVYVIVVGYGPDHDKAVTSWQNIAESNAHVKVEAANASTDAHAIANRILAMVQ